MGNPVPSSIRLLTDPYLKTQRARVHLEALKGELDAFYKLKPYTFTRYDDLKRKRHCVRVEFKDTPDLIHLILGDFVSCLRASLDQLVWALAKVNKPLSYPIHTNFPILAERDGKRLRDETRGVPAEARRIIESLQPYHGGNPEAITSHLLYRLHALWNIDKHRRIPIHGCELRFNLPQSLMLAVRFEEENKVYSVPIHLKREMRIHPNISFQVRFGDFEQGVLCDMGDVEAMYEFVTDKVIPRFARFFKW